jgi:hypothetical protein
LGTPTGGPYTLTSKICRTHASISNVRITPVSRSETHAKVRASLDNFGKLRKLLFNLIRENGSWRIDDIDIEHGDHLRGIERCAHCPAVATNLEMARALTPPHIPPRSGRPILQGPMAEAVKLYQELGFPALQRGGQDKKLVGYFQADTGMINQLVHLWQFDDDTDRRAHWASVYSNKDFVEGFASKFRPLLMTQEVKLLQAAPWGPHP